MIVIPPEMDWNKAKEMQKIFDEASFAQIRGWVSIGVSPPGFTSGLHLYAKEIAFIYFYNGLILEYETILKKAYESSKGRGGKGLIDTSILRYALLTDMSLDIIKTLWGKRGATVGPLAINAIDGAGQEIIEFMLSTKKFWKKLNSLDENDLTKLDLKSSVWMENDKFSAFAMKKYNDNGSLENLLPSTVKDIFIF